MEDTSMEEMTLAYASIEFGINRGTLANWVSDGRLPSELRRTELNQPYRVIRRGDLERLLQTRSTFGRPLKRAKKGA